jgi:ribonuclease Z
MRLVFLGTGAGKPTPERNVSALALMPEQARGWYLFDCGEGTQHRLLQAPPSLGKLSAVFVSHLHGDHYYGLPGLLASKTLDGAFRPLTVYGPRGIGAFLQCALGPSQDELGYTLDVVEVAAGDVLRLGAFTVTVLPLVHSIESFAFYLQEHPSANRLDEVKLRADGLVPSPLYGRLKRGEPVVSGGRTYRPEDYFLPPLPARRVVIAGDNAEPEILEAVLERLDLLVHEATYTEAVYNGLAKGLMHTTAQRLATVAERFGVRNLVATHISARYGGSGRHSVAEIEAEMAAHYHGRAFVAADFDRFRLLRSGELVRESSVE